MPSLLLSKQLNRANTCQVWRKSDWICVKSFPCHSDSVWDLKLHNTTVVRHVTRDTRDTLHVTLVTLLLQATAGLDGTVILYDFVSDYDLRVRCYIQVDNILFIIYITNATIVLN